MSKYNDDLNKLVVAKRKDEIGVAEWRCIHSWEMIVVSTKMQRLNKNVVETISYGEYRDAFCRIISW